jgi:hypothetical protein
MMLKRLMSPEILVVIFMAALSIWPTSQPTVLAQSAQGLPTMVAGLTPKGWEIFDRVKQFTPENLYKQINGRAELFQAYDMNTMTFASFTNSADKGQFIDLSLYDMGTPTNAFGVFSAERSQGEASLELGRLGYRSDANYYIWKGQYYIKVIASDPAAELKRIGLDLARRATASLLDSGEQVWGLNALPEKDRVPDSEIYYKVDALGLDFMHNTYTARYRRGDSVVTAFLSQRESPAIIRESVELYVRHAQRYGEGVEHLKVGGVKLVSCDMGGSYDVIFQMGRLMGGVFSVEDRDLALKTAIDFWTQLRSD